MPEIKQFPFTPILGWSASRYDLFSICKRRYFYHYYGKYDPEIPSRRINRFKNLVSIPLETGGIVHKVIEVLLNRLRTTAQDIDRERFIDFSQRTTRHRVQSKEFEEVVYGQVEQVSVEDVFTTVMSNLNNLLDSDRFRWLVEDAIGTASEWVIDPPGYGESRLGDLKVYCKVDFMFPIDDEAHILDWKTGKEDQEKHRKQLMGYATWATFHLGIEPERVKPSIAYLQPDYHEVHETFNAFDLENFGIRVRAETDQMYEYCRDIENNIPQEKSEFPLVDDRRICSYCNFRGICFPDEYPTDL